MLLDPLNPVHVDPMLLAWAGLAAAVAAPAYLTWAAGVDGLAAAALVAVVEEALVQSLNNP
jgi:hypothetical protein